MKAITCATLLTIIGSSALAYDTTIADAHLAGGRYQDAENAYVRLHEQARAVGDTSTQSDMHKKLLALYDKAGWIPLNHFVKKGLEILRPKPEKPPLAASFGPIGPSYPSVVGPVADYLTKYSKLHFDQSCRERVPGYIGSSHYVGFVFQLPNGNYSVLSTCDGSISDESGSYKAGLTVSEEVEFQLHSGNEPRIIKRSVFVSRVEEDGPKKKDPNSFDEFTKRAKEESDAKRAEDARHTEVANREAARKESEALAIMRQKEAEVTGTSYMSRYNRR